MTEIPVHAHVECSDGSYGKSTDVIVDRQTLQATHFVVQANLFDSLRLVPIEAVTGYNAQVIHLKCRKAEVDEFPLFIDRDYVQSEDMAYMYYPAVGSQDWGAPTMIPSLGPQPIAIDHVNIPKGSVEIPQGMPVQANDGAIGHVDYLLSDEKTGKITHVVLQHGHLWGKKEVAVPLDAVDHVDDEAVYLKIGRADVAQLPERR
jgi:hypothetical protein